MALGDVTKEGHRVNMFFPAGLYSEMKSWVSLHQTNIAELCREAIRHFLQEEGKKMKENELIETCRILSLNRGSNINQWTGLDEEAGDDESIGLQKRRYRSGEG